MATIAEILGGEPPHVFEFNGRRFEYHRGSYESGTFETLFTLWDNNSRSVKACGNEMDLKQQLAILLSHRFRKGVSAAQRNDIIAQARQALGRS